MAIYAGVFGFVATQFTGTDNVVTNTTYAFDKWSLTVDCALADITNVTGNNFQSVLDGGTGASLTVEGPYDVPNMNFGAGSLYTFLLGIANGVYFSVPARVGSVTVANDVNDRAKLTINAMSDSSITAVAVLTP